MGNSFHGFPTLESGIDDLHGFAPPRWQTRMAETLQEWSLDRQDLIGTERFR